MPRYIRLIGGFIDRLQCDKQVIFQHVIVIYTSGIYFDFRAALK